MILAITETPASLATLLGLTLADPAQPQVVWSGRLQNLGPGTVRHLRAAAAPDPATDVGFRRGPDAEWTETLVEDDPVWLWATGPATVVAEPSY